MASSDRLRSGRIITAHQPAYMPWLGYLDRIARADVFVFLDNVQFEKNSYTNRNRIKGPNASQWLTVPVRLQNHLEQTVSDLKIDNSQPWRRKHLRAIEANYGKAAHFKDCQPSLLKMMDDDTEFLADLCWNQLKYWVHEFGITTELVRARDLGLKQQKSELVLELCTLLQGTRYISGPLGKDYLMLDEFAAAGVMVEFDDFRHPEYPQLWGDFVPNLSIIDYWMNCGAVRWSPRGHQ